MSGELTPPETLGFEYTDPSPITEFDETDLSAASSSSKDDSSLMLSLVPPTVLLGSLLEHLCSMHESDADKANQLFLAICHRLSEINVLSPIAYLKEFTSIRSQYKAAFYNVIHSSIANLRNETFSSDLPYHLPLINGINNLSNLNTPNRNVFNFDASRYAEEFDELECIGRGGYGYVYKSKSKIDGQLYAIKVISFSSSNLHENEMNSSRILREVQILACLQHKNIVRYHSAWIEHKLQKLNNNKEKMRTDDESDVELEYTSKEDAECKSYSSSHVSGEGDNASWDQNKNLMEFSNSLTSKSSVGQTEKNSLFPPSKFWRDSLNSDSESTEKVPKKLRNKKVSNLKTRFTISPDSLSSKDDNFTWDNNSHEKHVCFEDPSLKLDEHQQFVAAASPPSGDGVIITHGVRRDREMRKVKSFIIPKAKMNTSHNKEDELHIEDRMFSTGNPQKRSRSYTNMNDSCLQSKELLPMKSLPIINKNPRLIINQIKEKMVMYIQMQLCQTSLKEWLVSRNQKILAKRSGLSAIDEGYSLSILKQILSALCFVHKRGLIHRDIKPRNIFINDVENPQILLGDFGLARKDVDTASGSEAVEPITPLISAGRPFKFHKSTSYTSGVGTATYAAPEQLNGDVYDMKADMYSLGIVVYELWWPLGTFMERANHLKLLRLPAVKIPQDFQNKNPMQAASLHRLLQHDPALRPSAEEMIKSSFIAQSSGKIIIHQRKRIWELERENETLKHTIKSLQKQIFKQIS